MGVGKNILLDTDFCDSSEYDHQHEIQDEHFPMEVDDAGNMSLPTMIQQAKAPSEALKTKSSEEVLVMNPQILETPLIFDSGFYPDYTFSTQFPQDCTLFNPSPELINPFFHQNTSFDSSFAANEDTFAAEMLLNINMETSFAFPDYGFEDCPLFNPPPVLFNPWSHQETWDHLVHSEEIEQALHNPSPSNLKLLLIDCAQAIDDNRFADFQKFYKLADKIVSVRGEPIQRLGAYVLEGLAARKELSGTNIYKKFDCKEVSGKELRSYMQILYENCPYIKFGYMAANGAIQQACGDDDSIHIIDFQIARGVQWMLLLGALGRPHDTSPRVVRITGFDDAVSRHARGSGLESLQKELTAIAEKNNIRLQFHAFSNFAPDMITQEKLQVRPGEALAVNFPLLLHHIPDESVDPANPRDRVLHMVKSLNPKVVTLVEQECNVNTAPFIPRFKEVLDYYIPIFESIHEKMPQNSETRMKMEENCLAREIVNIIACEGKERVERHELLGKWSERFRMAGFRSFPLNGYVNSLLRQKLLNDHSDNYTLEDKEGALLLGWKDRNLISASAWNL